jgi:hypothetical protein
MFSRVFHLEIDVFPGKFLDLVFFIVEAEDE